MTKQNAIYTILYIYIIKNAKDNLISHSFLFIYRPDDVNIHNIIAEINQSPVSVI